MTTFRKNVDFFKNASADIYRTIVEEPVLNSIYLQKMDNQNNYVMESENAKCFMHSMYDLEHEMEMMFANTPQDVSSIVLFGFGNGYAIEYIKKKYENIDEIIIIEPSLQIFKNYLQQHNIQKALKKHLSITFVVNKKESEAIQRVMGRLSSTNKTSFVFHVSYTSVFSSYYNSVFAELTKAIRAKKVLLTRCLFHGKTGLLML